MNCRIRQNLNVVGKHGERKRMRSEKPGNPQSRACEALGGIAKKKRKVGARLRISIFGFMDLCSSASSLPVACSAIRP